MGKKGYLVIIGLLLIASLSFADTFKHRQTGEVFHGYATQNTLRNMTMVYAAEEQKLKKIDLSEYEVTYDKQGRKDGIIVIPVKREEIIISKAASTEIAEAIENASNSGPRFIILEIDNPGGRGEYMRIIASAVIKTKNCPVYAYISSEKYGGAFSAAMIPALACDRIYMDANATIGSLAPIITSLNANNADMDYTNLYAPKTLASYQSFAAALAENKGRPGIFAKACLDRSIEVVEIQDIDKKKSFIDKNDRKATDTITRTITNRTDTNIEDLIEEGSDSETQPQAVNKAPEFILTLSSEDALKTGLVDKIVYSIEDIARDMNASDGQLVFNRSVDKVVKQFLANKRNVDKALVTIDFLQQNADRLQEQFTSLQDQLRNQTVTRSYRRSDDPYTDYQSSRYNRNYNNYNNRYDNRYNNNRYNNRSNRYNNRYNEGETITTEQPIMTPQALYIELNNVLTNLVREYKRTINITKRFPGTLPPGITVNTLQKRLDAAVAQAANLQRSAFNTMQPY